MNCNVVIRGDCVGELDVGPSLTWETVVDFLISLWPLVFPQQLFGFPVLYGFSLDCNMCEKFVNDVK